MLQKKVNSPIVKGSMATSIFIIVAYISKEFFDKELDNNFIEAVIFFAYVIYQEFATWNNPNRSDSF